MTNPTTPPREDDVPWLTADEREAWMTLISLLASLPTAIDGQLKRDAGMNFFEYSILSALSRPPGRAVRMTTLAQYAGGSVSRLSHAVTRMERQGWVRREVHSSEPRCTEAMLTDKGMAVLEAAAPGHVREARRLVFDAITLDQVAQLRQICRQLVDAAAPDLADALDRAIAEAAKEDRAETDGGVAAFDQAILEHTAESPCTAALEEAAAEQAAPARTEDVGPGVESSFASSCTEDFESVAQSRSVGAGD